MSETTTTKREFLQIGRVDAKGKIMDITDPDPKPTLYNPKESEFAPKFEINYTRYSTETSKAEVMHRHWIDANVLDLLAWDLLTNKKGEKLEKGYKAILVEFKGGSAKAAGITELGDDGIVSRKLQVSYNDSLNIGPVYQFTFSLQEGVKGKNGQITPVKDGRVFLPKEGCPPETINIPVDNARLLGKKILRYLQSKEAAALVGHYFIK